MVVVSIRFAEASLALKSVAAGTKTVLVAEAGKLPIALAGTTAPTLAAPAAARGS
jgi:hypothetical protein